MAETKLVIDAEIVVPGFPNYVNAVVNGVQVQVGIETLTDDQLRALGKIWTEALVKHAEKRRNNIAQSKKDMKKLMVSR